MVAAFSYSHAFTNANARSEFLIHKKKVWKKIRVNLFYVAYRSGNYAFLFLFHFWCIFLVNVQLKFFTVYFWTKEILFETRAKLCFFFLTTILLIGIILLALQLCTTCYNTFQLRFFFSHVINVQKDNYTIFFCCSNGGNFYSPTLIKYATKTAPILRLSILFFLLLNIKRNYFIIYRTVLLCVYLYTKINSFSNNENVRFS